MARLTEQEMENALRSVEAAILNWLRKPENLDIRQAWRDYKGETRMDFAIPPVRSDGDERLLRRLVEKHGVVFALTPEQSERYYTETLKHHLSGAAMGVIFWDIHWRLNGKAA